MGEFEDKLNSILSDPEQMDKIAGLAKSLMGGEQETKESSAFDGLGAMFGAESGMDLGKMARLLS